MSNIADEYIGQELELSFKSGKLTNTGYSIISRVSGGKIVNLLKEHENTPLVTNGSTWLCKIAMIFENKVIVQALKEI